MRIISIVVRFNIEIL